MIGASVYAHNLAQFNDTTVPQVTENEQNVLTEFLDSTLITSSKFRFSSLSALTARREVALLDAESTRH